MTKLSKESILPLAGMLTGMEYSQSALRALEDMQSYNPSVSKSVKAPLTKKQVKSRAKAKAAKKARKRK